MALAATVAGFDTDPDAVQALVVAAREGRFDGRLDHVAPRLCDDRTAADRTTQPTSCVRPRSGSSPPADAAPALPVHRLVNADGARPTVEDHAGCPGHVAYIAGRYGWVDPERHPVTDGDGDECDEDDVQGSDEDDDQAGGAEARQWGGVTPCRCWPAPVRAPTATRNSWGKSGGAADRIPVDQMSHEQREAALAQRRDVVESDKA